MAIKIYTKEEAGITYEQLVELMHESFQERLEQGLRFTCSFMDADKYAEKTKNGIILVAIDDNTKELLGTVTITIKCDVKNVIYGYHEYLAIYPKGKHLGIASQLLENCKSIITKYNGGYILSDTACEATSSVKWHLKNGFYIYELESYRSTNYWSYVFVKPLNDNKQFSPVRIKLHYWKSYVFIKLTRHKDGSDSTLGKLYKKLR